MSKEKVDAYKERKANRKQIIAKEKKRRKRNKVLGIVAVVVVVGALAIALGLTGWNQYQDYLGSIPDYDRTEMVVSDYTGVLSTEEDTEDETETVAEEENEAESDSDSESDAESDSDTEAETTAE